MRTLRVDPSVRIQVKVFITLEYLALEFLDVWAYTFRDKLMGSWHQVLIIWLTTKYGGRLALVPEVPALLTVVVAVMPVVELNVAVPRGRALLSVSADGAMTVEP
jgi:hypothetical protein